jgi:hypothetical protein
VSKHLLILMNDTVRARAMRWVSRLPVGTRVEFSEPRRTTDQNAKLWALLGDVSRNHEHHGRRYSPDDWKVLFMLALGKEMRFAPSLDGHGFVPLGTRSSKLSKAEMSDLIEFILVYCAENEIPLSDPTLVQGRIAA